VTARARPGGECRAEPPAAPFPVPLGDAESTGGQVDVHLPWEDTDLPWEKASAPTATVPPPAEPADDELPPPWER
jgi:hypothetical protein